MSVGGQVGHGADEELLLRVGHRPPLPFELRRQGFQYRHLFSSVIVGQTKRAVKIPRLRESEATKKPWACAHGSVNIIYRQMGALLQRTAASKPRIL
jgi:hypothetical protein